MKHLLVALAVLLSLGIAGMVVAGEDEDPNHDLYATSQATYDTGNPMLDSWLNGSFMAKQTHEIYIPSRRSPMGIGGVVEYVFDDTWSAYYEGKVDFNNDNEISNFAMIKARFGNK